MKAFGLSLLLLLAVLAATCTQQAGVAPTPLGVSGGSLAQNPGLPTEATIQFGNPNAPPFPHPGQSAHAADSLVPRTVAIAVDGTVTFTLSNAVHQVAIYEPGTRPRDIDTTDLIGFDGCPGGLGFPLYIDDDSGRVAVLDAPPCGGGSFTPSFTFTAAGRYLVICSFLPHFEAADLYGWVIVK